MDLVKHEELLGRELQQWTKNVFRAQEENLDQR